MLQSTVPQRVRYNLAAEQQQPENLKCLLPGLFSALQTSCTWRLVLNRGRLACLPPAGRPLRISSQLAMTDGGRCNAEGWVSHHFPVTGTDSPLLDITLLLAAFSLSCYILILLVVVPVRATSTSQMQYFNPSLCFGDCFWGKLKQK